MRLRSGERAGFEEGGPAPALRRLSQNFLADRAVAARMVAAVAPGPADRVLEIGPGRGALTRELAARAGALLAVELDRRLAERLARELAGEKQVQVIHGDILALALAPLAAPGRLRLIGNLPYGISSPIVLKVLDELDAVADAVFLFQKEFAARLCAPAGTPAYGSLGALAAARLHATRLFDVPPAAFVPRPTVWSSAVRLEPLDRPLVAPERWDALKRVLRAAFSGRRKTLANALGHGLGLGRDAATALLAAAALDPGARAETVSPEGFARLAGLLDPGVADI